MIRVVPKLLLAVAAALMAWSTWVVLRPPAARYPDRFQPWLRWIDANGDGVVNAKEFDNVAVGGPDFDRYDIDGNGRLSLYEIEAGFLYIDPLWLYDEPD